MLPSTNRAFVGDDGEVVEGGGGVEEVAAAGGGHHRAVARTESVGTESLALSVSLPPTPQQQAGSVKPLTCRVYEIRKYRASPLPPCGATVAYDPAAAAAVTMTSANGQPAPAR